MTIVCHSFKGRFPVHELIGGQKIGIWRAKKFLTDPSPPPPWTTEDCGKEGIPTVMKVLLLKMF
jgi:hypothetical protein